MSPLTENRSTEKRLGFGLAPLVKDAEIIFTGAMVAIDKTTGEAEPAADAANLVVKGRANEYVDNTDDGLRVQIEVGIFCWENSADNAVADTNLICYVEDDQTVSSDPGNNAVIAGVVVDIDDDGVWVDCHPAAVAAAIGKNPVAAVVAAPAALTATAPDAVTATAPDALTATAPDALTAADPAAVTTVDPTWGDTTSADQAANLTTFTAQVVADLGAIRDEVVKLIADNVAMHVPVAANVVDVAAMRVPVAANVVDVAAMRVPVAANVVDVAAMRTPIAGSLTALKTAGLMASA